MIPILKMVNFEIIFMFVMDSNSLTWIYEFLNQNLDLIFWASKKI